MKWEKKNQPENCNTFSMRIMLTPPKRTRKLCIEISENRMFYLQKIRIKFTRFVYILLSNIWMKTVIEMESETYAIKSKNQWPKQIQLHGNYWKKNVKLKWVFIVICCCHQSSAMSSRHFTQKSACRLIKANPFDPMNCADQIAK